MPLDNSSLSAIGFDTQVNTQDPFSIARKKFEARKEIPDESSVLDNPFSGITQNAFQPVPFEINNAKDKEMSELLASSKKENITDFTTSKIPDMLNTLGIDSKGIALNPMGKIQLHGRLKSKLGDNYMGNKIAKQIMDNFDNYLKNAKVDTTRDLTKMSTQATRTLDQLLKLQKEIL